MDWLLKIRWQKILKAKWMGWSLCCGVLGTCILTNFVGTGCLFVFNIGEEVPFYKEKKKCLEKYLARRPRHAPKEGTEEYEFLEKFCSRVELILQTVNDNEYQAATTFLEKPGDMFERAVVFPYGGACLLRSEWP